MTNEEIINNWLEDSRTDLIENYKRLGLKASGKWAESLESFIEQNGKQKTIGISGQHYTFYIQNYRGKNKKQSDEDVRKWVGWAASEGLESKGGSFISNWVKDKGLIINPFAVAYKIARKGWVVPNRFNAGGLVSDVITKDRISQLNVDLTQNAITEFKSTIIKEFK